MKKLLFRIAGILATFTAPLLISSVAHAANVTWDGGGADNNWSTAANWSGDTLPVDGDVLIFDMTIPTSYGEVINNDLTALNVAGITLTGTGTANKSFVVTGNALTISGPITGTQTSGSVTLDLNIALGANVVYSVPMGSVSFGRSSAPITDFDLSTFDFSISNTASDICEKVTMYSSLKGSGNISTATGSSALSLYEGANGYSGDLTIAGYGLSVGQDAVYMSSIITMNGSSQLYLVSANPAVFDVNIVMNSSADPALIASANHIVCSNVSNPPKVKLHAGSLTLQRNTIFSGNNDLLIDVTYTPNGHTLTIKSGSEGALTTADGTLAAPVETITVESTDIDTNAGMVVGFNQTYVIKGQRGYVNIMNGGVLKGTGTVGVLNVNSGGTLAPGLSPGCINSGDLNFFSSSTYQVELQDIVECTKYDQTKVTGSVNLGDATLQIVRYNNMVPRIGNAFKIIDNDGTDAVTGTFAGLAQGATTTVDGITYTISYTGGDGNDVVLTVTGVNASLGAPNTGALQLLKSGAVLPLLAMLSGVGILAVQYVTSRRR